MGAVQEKRPQEEGSEDEDLRAVAIEVLGNRVDEVAPMAIAEMVHAAAGWIYITEYKIMSDYKLRFLTRDIIQGIERLRDRLIYTAKVLDEMAEVIGEKRNIRNYSNYVKRIHELIRLGEIRAMIKDVRKKILTLLGNGPTFDKRWPLYAWLAIYVTYRTEDFLDLIEREIDRMAKYAESKGGKEGVRVFHASIKLVAHRIIK